MIWICDRYLCSCCAKHEFVEDIYSIFMYINMCICVHFLRGVFVSSEFEIIIGFSSLRSEASQKK